VKSGPLKQRWKKDNSSIHTWTDNTTNPRYCKESKYNLSFKQNTRLQEKLDTACIYNARQQIIQTDKKVHPKRQKEDH
jgi:hypothetical protein